MYFKFLYISILLINTCDEKGTFRCTARYGGLLRSKIDHDNF